MRKTTIKASCYILPLLFLLLQGCGVLFLREEDQLKQQEAQFEPFRQRNTIEAYQEFIRQYPDNMFVNLARGSIQNLEFAPYEKQDTIEGYREFMKTFPANPSLSRANARIDQLEFKQIEDADTVAAYAEFLQRHPGSNYTMLARQRMQEIEFQSLVKTCQERYGFDLLLYRLNVNRLQKELESIDVSNLSDFRLFASFDAYQNKRCFHTHLIYGDAIMRPDMKTKEASELFFNSVIARLLFYLDKKFTNKKEIDGFCFTISSSSARFYGDSTVMFAYYFSAESVHQFAEGTLGQRELFAQAAVNIPASSPQSEKDAVSQPAPLPRKQEGRE